MAKLVTFLGNPGPRYAKTRHNLPWLVLSRLAISDDLNWQSRFKGEYAEMREKDHKVLYLKPQKFMNVSGESVVELANFYRIAPDEILIVHDEVELDFGTYELRLGGGLAGHKGLRSIANNLGTRQFYRLRIGVGRPKRGDVSAHVLGKLNEEEFQLLADLASGIEPLLTGDPSTHTGRYTI